MKKKLFLALLTTLLLLLAASTALAADYSDYTCTSCGNPCEGWYPLSDNGLNYHVPACYSCGIVLLDKKEHCTPKDGTATCKSAPRCNVCSLTMSVEYGPDPDAHSMVESWSFYNETQHFRVCQNSCGKTEYADHTGGTATCSAKAVCTDCGNEYGALSDANHGAFSDWEPYTATQHYRYCIECSENYEYADHTGGTASCTQMPECEVCHKPYGDLSDTNHGAFTEWTPIGDTQHYRYCTDCGNNAEYADHTGGTATCTERAVCDVCHTPYGEFSDTNHGEFSDWMGVNNAQHLRYCTSCGLNKEYADHTGGTATCMEYAVCEVCHAPYGELSTTNHGEFTDWMPYTDDDTQHYRRCQDCGWNREYASHTGGTATCTERAVCDVCHGQYGELSDANHGEFTDWIHYDDTQHYRSCIDCRENREYADHTGGTATCASGPICEVCGVEYGEPLSTHNGPFGEWERVTVGQHWRMCETCTDYEREDHTGGTATCAAYPVCDVCHEEYGSRSSTHTGNLSYEYLSVDHHYTTCDVCNGTFTDPHTGGTATCESGPICELCETAYGETLGGHIPNAEATCTTDQICTRDGCGAVLNEKLGHAPNAEATCTTDQICTRDGCGAVLAQKLGHSWSDWTDNGDGTHTRTCQNDAAHTETGDCEWDDWLLLDGRCHERRCGVCHAQELGEHAGGTATCSQPATCEDCGASYGSPDNSGLTGHPDPVIEQKAATCYTEGYYRIICNEPGCSAPFTEFIFPTGGQHLYTHWDILGGNMHHTDCAVCGEYTDVGCTLWGMLDGETLLTVCPVCGDFAETPFEVLIAREDTMVPIGTLLVRGLKVPFPGALYGFTTAGVYGGEIVDIHGPVTVTLPVDLAELGTFTVVRVDMVDGEERRTEIPFTLEDGLLTIETDTAGLFLLIPAE